MFLYSFPKGTIRFPNILCRLAFFTSDQVDQIVALTVRSYGGMVCSTSDMANNTTCVKHGRANLTIVPGARCTGPTGVPMGAPGIIIPGGIIYSSPAKNLKAVFFVANSLSYEKSKGNTDKV